MSQLISSILLQLVRAGHSRPGSESGCDEECGCWGTHRLRRFTGVRGSCETRDRLRWELQLLTALGAGVSEDFDFFNVAKFGDATIFRGNDRRPAIGDRATLITPCRLRVFEDGFIKLLSEGIVRSRGRVVDLQAYRNSWLQSGLCSWSIQSVRFPVRLLKYNEASELVVQIIKELYTKFCVVV